MPEKWQIAQLNIATALYPLDDERIEGFVNKLDEVNQLADSSPGYVWRLQTESGDATEIQVGDDPLLIVNMSVWDTIESLFNFAYKSAHKFVLADRKKWFKKSENAYQVLWWVPSETRPSVEEGMEKLALLQKFGPTQQAFTFKNNFPEPDIKLG